MLLSACSDNRILVIDNFSETKKFNFTTPTETLFNIGDGVQAIFIDVEGNISGKLGIGGSCGGIVTGKVDTTFRCDWYSSEASMLLIPQGEVKGKLKITFRFSKI